jgi:hypothetical protein
MRSYAVTQLQNLLSCLRTIVWKCITICRQLYRTLLRGRNVDDFHRRVQQWLACFP